MKKQKNNLDLEVEKTMASLDNHQRLEANPYLYTRIKQRLSSQKESKDFGWLSLARLQPLLFATLLLANVFTVYSTFNKSTTEEDYIEVLAREYKVQSIDFSQLYSSE